MAETLKKNSHEYAFLQLLYAQVFAYTASLMHQWHGREKRCFDAVLVSADPTLVLPQTLNSIYDLPSISGLHPIALGLAKQHPYKVLVSKLSNLFQPANHVTDFFHISTFNSAYFKRIAHFPDKSFTKLTSQSLSKTLRPLLQSIDTPIQTLVSCQFQSKTTHQSYRHFSRTYARLKVRTKEPSLADIQHLIENWHNFLSYVTSDPLHDNDLIHLLENILNVHINLSDFYIKSVFFKLHCLIGLELASSDTADWKDLCRSMQHDCVTELGLHQGPLCNCNHHIQVLFEAIQNVDIQQLNETQSKHLFNLKQQQHSFEYDLKARSSAYWVNYLTMYATSDLKHLGEFVIKIHHSTLSAPYLATSLAGFFEQYNSTLLNICGDLPLSIQTQENRTLRVPNDAYKALCNAVESLNATLNWSILLGLYWAQEGRYSCLGDTLIQLTSTQNTQVLQRHYFQLISLLLSSSAFKSFFQYLTQLYPKTALDLCCYSSSLDIYIAPDQRALHEWFTGSDYLNRCSSQLHQQLSQVHSECWERLYPFMTRHFIENSDYITHWIEASDSSSLHPLLASLITYLDRNNTVALRLLSRRLHAAKLRHPLIESFTLHALDFSNSLTQSVSIIRHLLESHVATAAPIQSCLHDLVYRCELLAMQSSSLYLSHFIKDHAEHWAFLLRLCIESSHSYTLYLLQFLSVYSIPFNDTLLTLWEAYVNIAPEKPSLSQKQWLRTLKPSLSPIALSLLKQLSSTKAPSSTPTIKSLDILLEKLDSYLLASHNNDLDSSVILPVTVDNLRPYLSPKLTTLCASADREHKTQLERIILTDSLMANHQKTLLSHFLYSQESSLELLPPSLDRLKPALSPEYILLSYEKLCEKHPTYVPTLVDEDCLNTALCSHYSNHTTHDLKRDHKLCFHFLQSSRSRDALDLVLTHILNTESLECVDEDVLLDFLNKGLLGSWHALYTRLRDSLHALSFPSAHGAQLTSTLDQLHDLWAELKPGIHDISLRHIINLNVTRGTVFLMHCFTHQTPECITALNQIFSLTWTANDWQCTHGSQALLSSELAQHIDGFITLRQEDYCLLLQMILYIPRLIKPLFEQALSYISTHSPDHITTMHTHLDQLLTMSNDAAICDYLYSLRLSLQEDTVVLEQELQHFLNTFPLKSSLCMDTSVIEKRFCMLSQRISPVSEYSNPESILDACGLFILTLAYHEKFSENVHYLEQSAALFMHILIHHPNAPSVHSDIANSLFIPNHAFIWKTLSQAISTLDSTSTRPAIRRLLLTLKHLDYSQILRVFDAATAELSIDTRVPLFISLAEVSSASKTAHYICQSRQHEEIFVQLFDRFPGVGKVLLDILRRDAPAAYSRLTLLWKQPKWPLLEGDNPLTYVCTHHPGEAGMYIDFLYLSNPDTFWHYCYEQDCSGFETLIRFLTQAANSGLPLPTPELALQWSSHPAFLHALNQSKSRPAYFLNVNPLADAAPDSAVLTWLESQFFNASFSTCFSYFSRHPKAGFEAFANLFFIKQSHSLPKLTPDCFLLYLNQLPSSHMHDFIHYLETKWDLSIKHIMQTIMSYCLHSASTYDFSIIIFKLSPYLSTQKSSLDPTLDIWLSRACLCNCSSLDLSVLLYHLKRINFVPADMLATHFKTLASSFLDPDEHAMLVPLAAETPILFQAIICSEPCAKAIYRLSYHQLWPEHSLLYDVLTDHIRTLSFSNALEWIRSYCWPLVTSSKHAALDSLLSRCNSAVHQSNDDLNDWVTELYTLINSPLLKLSPNDTLFSLALTQLQHESKQLQPSDSMLYMLSSSTQPPALNTRLSHTKLTLETQTLILLHLRSSSDTLSLIRFNNIIHDWHTHNSLYHHFNSDLHSALHDYCVDISHVCMRFSWNNFQIPHLKRCCEAIHFLLNHLITPEPLRDWICTRFIPEFNAHYLHFLLPCLTSEDLANEHVETLLSACFTHHPLAQLPPIIKATAQLPAFIPAWESLLKSQKRHEVLAAIGIETQAIHGCLKDIFIQWAIDENPAIFSFCDLHHAHQVPLDIFFIYLYDHFFPEGYSPPNNVFIKHLQTAIQFQHTAFLTMLAHCIEHYVIANKRQWSFVIQHLQDLYRIPIQTSASSTDFSTGNVITKAFIKEGLLSDQGTLLYPITDSSFEDLKHQLPDTSAAYHAAFHDLHQSAIGRYHQQTLCLSTLSQHAPSAILTEHPTSLDLSANKGSYILDGNAAYFNCLLAAFFTTNTVPLAFHHCIDYIFSTPELKSRFVRLIKCLSESQLNDLLCHPEITYQERHGILYALLNTHHQDHANSPWENLLCDSILDLLLPHWKPVMSLDAITAQLECLCFFMIHFPEHAERAYLPLSELIFKHTGLCLAHVDACKHRFQLIYDPATPSLATLSNLFHSLLESGFTLFECQLAYRCCSFYNAKHEQNCLDLFLIREPIFAHDAYDSIFLNLLDYQSPKTRTRYVSDQRFDQTPLSRAFKAWCIEHGHLDAFNRLDLCSIDDLKSHYSCSDVLQSLYNSICNTHPVTISPPTEDDLSSLFITLLPPTQRHPHCQYAQMHIVTQWSSIHMSIFSRRFGLSRLRTLHKILCTNQLVQILDAVFMPLLAILCKTPHALNLLIHSIPIQLDLEHSIFSSISISQKQDFKSYLVAKKILDSSNSIIIQNPSTHSTLSSLKSQQHNHALLQRFCRTQHQLWDSAIHLMVGLIHIIMNTSTSSEVVLRLWGSIPEHEFLYLKRLLPQQINKTSIEFQLQKRLKTRKPISKSLLQSYAKHQSKLATDSNSPVKLLYTLSTIDPQDTQTTPKLQDTLYTLLVLLEDN